MEPLEAFEGLLGLSVLLVIAYLIGVDANKRERSGLLWGLFVFLSCLIAVPIYFLLISNDK